MTLLLTALAIVLTPTALVLAWVEADSYLARREEDKRRAEQEREVDDEWLAVLAATEETPIYDRLMCESIEREEWPA